MAQHESQAPWALAEFVPVVLRPVYLTLPTQRSLGHLTFDDVKSLPPRNFVAKIFFRFFKKWKKKYQFEKGSLFSLTSCIFPLSNSLWYEHAHDIYFNYFVRFLKKWKLWKSKYFLNLGNFLREFFFWSINSAELREFFGNLGKISGKLGTFFE